MPTPEAVTVDATLAGPPTEEPSQLSAVFEALGDATCRTILRALRQNEQAMTVQELATIADVSLTSTYRKLEKLDEAGLVTEHDELDEDGHRRSRYRSEIDQIEVTLATDGDVAVSLYSSPTKLRLAEV